MRLASVKDIRGLLERAAGLLNTAGGDVVARVGAMARVASAALEALKIGEIEREAQELRELVR